MKEYFKKLPKEILDLIHLVSHLALRKDMRVYLVGGFVRDLILKVKNLDLDIVVENNGIAFAEELARILGAKLVRHRQFQTATIILRTHHKIDIATARKEFYPEPAHLPIVVEGTLKDDLSRRDFTINAMAISLNQRDFGSLIDFFGGTQDLGNKKINILHDLSFIDDPTRILRAIRFEQRYNFKIEPGTLNCLKGAVRLGMLKKVQPQRLRDDLILILKEKKPLKEIRRLSILAGLDFIHGHLKVSKKTYNLLRSIEREINWFKKRFPERRLLDIWIIYFIGLIDSLSITEIVAICKKFVFRKGEEKRILGFKKINRKFILTLGQNKLKPSKIFSLLEPLSYEAIILLKAKYKKPAIQSHISDFFEIYNGMRILIDGSDLQRSGVLPGPYYQKVFAKVLKAKLEGRVKTREEELALMREIIKDR